MELFFKILLSLVLFVFGQTSLIYGNTLDRAITLTYVNSLTEQVVDYYLYFSNAEIAPDIHLSRIRKEWDKFYDEFPAGTMPTRKQVLDYAKHVDDLYGKYFSPQIRIE